MAMFVLPCIAKELFIAIPCPNCCHALATSSLCLVQFVLLSALGNLVREKKIERRITNRQILDLHFRPADMQGNACKQVIKFIRVKGSSHFKLFARYM